MLKLIISLFLLLQGCSIQPKNQEYQEPLSFMVTSDMHYQQDNLEAQTGIVPQMEYNTLISEALINQALNDNVDAFILCGDNTNNVIEKDHQALIDQLTKLKNAGIKIVVVPGNHDLFQFGKENYRKMYQTLIYDEAILKDDVSLSYVMALNEEVWIVVADSNDDNARGGKLTSQTMDWLKSVLAQAKKEHKTVLFASHHNVLPNSQKKYQETYLIENEELVPLLKKYGVQLILSGHRHVQQTAMMKGLTEVVSGMPIAWPNAYSYFYLNQDRTLEFQVKTLNDVKIDGIDNFRQYSQEVNLKRLKNTVSISLASLDLSELEYRQMEELYIQVSMAYNSGQLQGQQDTLKEHPGYTLWIEKASEVNYSSWIQYLLEKDCKYDAQFKIQLQ